MKNKHLFFLLIIKKSSTNPSNAYAINTNITISKFTENSILFVNNRMIVVMIVGIIKIIPPIVGVPDFLWWAST